MIIFARACWTKENGNRHNKEISPSVFFSFFFVTPFNEGEDFARLKYGDRSGVEPSRLEAVYWTATTFN